MKGRLSVGTRANGRAPGNVVTTAGHEPGRGHGYRVPQHYPKRNGFPSPAVELSPYEAEWVSIPLLPVILLLVSTHRPR